MTHEEFKKLFDNHFKPHVTPDGEHGMVMVYRSEGHVQFLIEGLPMAGLLDIIAHLSQVVGNPFFVMAAVSEGLSRPDGVGVEILGTDDKETGTELVEMIKANLGANEEVEWPEDLGAEPAR